MPLRRVAEILRNEGYKCNSHETARAWASRGKALCTAKEDLDPDIQKHRDVAGLEQWMDRLTQLADDPDKVLDALAHLKWMYQLRARWIGFDAPTNVNVNSGPVEPQDFIQRMVGRDPEETFDPNGRR
jgi:Fe-S-cluster formation regulator IscX/YfhJ